MRKKQEELLKKNGCKAQLNDTQYYSSSDGKSANFCFTIVLGNCLVLGKDYKCPSGYSTKYYDSNDRALGNICVKLETYSGPRASPHGAR